MTLPHVSEDTYHSVRDYPVEQYRCGAKAGDRVRLRRDIGVHPVGQIWSVLRGAAEEPIVIWLRQADGETHTWSDDEDFLATFEILPRDAI
jgi:hypothetical protein